MQKPRQLEPLGHCNPPFCRSLRKASLSLSHRKLSVLVVLGDFDNPLNGNLTIMEAMILSLILSKIMFYWHRGMVYAWFSDLQ